MRDERCACGHTKAQHIYHEGACRPGFACERGCTEFTPLVATPSTDGGREGVIDDAVTRLYRRFKEWSKRGFGPDDVTWCEVRAEVAELLALRAAHPPAHPVVTEAMVEDAARLDWLNNTLHEFGGGVTTDEHKVEVFIDYDLTIVAQCETLRDAIDAARAAATAEESEAVD